MDAGEQRLYHEAQREHASLYHHFSGIDGKGKPPYHASGAGYGLVCLGN